MQIKKLEVHLYHMGEKKNLFECVDAYPGHLNSNQIIT
jgi:hypothetical protein